MKLIRQLRDLLSRIFKFSLGVQQVLLHLLDRYFVYMFNNVFAVVFFLLKSPESIDFSFVIFYFFVSIVMDKFKFSF